jgi:glutamate 5-kinase
VGRLYLDEGAVIAISRGGKSLLPAGIKMLEGEFDSQDAVQLCDLQGNEIARGLVNYNSQELAKIRGCHSRDIEDILGYAGLETVVHRDNLVLI